MRRLVLVVLGLAAALLSWWLQDASRAHVSRERQELTGKRAPLAPPPEQARTERSAVAGSGEDFPASIALVGSGDEAIVVQAVDPAGKPARAVRVELVEQRTQRTLAEGVTGEDGRFWFEQPPPRKVRVYHLPGNGFDRQSVGAWSPRNPRTVRFEVFPPCELVARIRVDGIPAFPKALGLEGVAFLEESRDERAGLMVLRVLPRRRQSALVARAPGMIAAQAPVAFGSNAAPQTCELRLYRACRLDLRLMGDLLHLRDLTCKRRDEQGRYVALRDDGLQSASRADGVSTISYSVPGGSYRLTTRNGIAVSEFDVAGERTAVDVDLRAARFVEVEVRAPALFNEPRHALRAVLEEPAGTVRGLVISGQSFLHPGNRPITIRAQSSALRPHPELGSCTLHAPIDVARVHLVKAPRSRFRWKLPPAGDPPIRDVEGAVFDESETPPPAATVPVDALGVELRSLENGIRTTDIASRAGASWRYSFTTPLDGRFALLIRDRGRGVVILPDVDLSRAVDLGTLRANSAHHVTIVARGLRGSLRIGVWDPQTELEIAAGLLHGQTTATVLGGVPAGKWQLRFHRGRSAWTQSIECAGGKAQVVEVDCSNR